MRLPEWFRVLLIVVMLAVCGMTCWHTQERAALQGRIEELSMMLDTSRQREIKQQLEYDEVAAALPALQAELAAAQPLADEAKAAENVLRDQRKQLRQDNAALESGIAEAKSERIRMLTALVEQLPPIQLNK